MVGSLLTIALLAAGSQAQPNLAASAQVSATRTIGAESPFADPTNAIDADPETCWAGEGTNLLADPIDFVLDFGEPVAIERVAVTTCRMKNQLRLTAFDLYGWAGTDWDGDHPLAKVRDRDDVRTECRFDPVRTSKLCLRLLDNTRPNHDFPHIAEIEVFGSEREPTQRLVPTGLPRSISQLATLDDLRAEAARLRERTSDSVAQARLALVEGKIARIEAEEQYHSQLDAIDRETDQLIAAGVPEWAAAQREALAKYVLWVHWWIDHQQPDGQFGGGWEDDVELVCGWPLACLAAGDEKTFDSLALLANGVWNWGPIKEHGYSAYTDVEHSAENTSYSQPRMVALDYGNPLYIDRCRKTTLTVAREFMGRNEAGNLQFRSDFFGYRDGQPAIDEKRAFDIPECAKALKPGLAVAWYGDDPEVRQILLDYADTWVAAAGQPREDGVPGLLPQRIEYPSGKAVGTCEWIPVMRALYYHLLGCYELSGDPEYLKPVEALIQSFVVDRSVRDIPFTRKWRDKEHAGTLSQLAIICSLWRMLTGDDRFDPYFERWSRCMSGAMGERHESYYFLDRAADDIWIRIPIDVGAFQLPRLAIGPQFYVGWLASGDKDLLAAGCRNLSCDLSDQWGPLTSWFYDKSETRVTSNDHLAHSIQPAASMLMLMYTGGPGPIEAKYPHLAVSWERTATDFAALVLEQGLDRLKVLACNTVPDPREVTMRVYDLDPGLYSLRIGPDADGDDQMDAPAVGKTVRLKRHSGLRLTLPSRQLQVIELSAAGSDAMTNPPDQQIVTDLPEPAFDWQRDDETTLPLELPAPEQLSREGPFTIVARFTCNAGRHEQVIVDNAAARGYHGFALGLTEDDKPQFAVRYHALVSWVRADEPIPIGEPCTIAGVFTGAEQKLFVNGKLAVTVDNTYYVPSKGPLIIGGSWGKSPILTFSGDVREIAFYNRALAFGG